MSLERVFGGLLLAAALGGVGYMLGQFAPFTGFAQIAEPFSPLRNQTAWSYAVVGSLIGGLVGLSVKPRSTKQRDLTTEASKHREGPIQ